MCNLTNNVISCVASSEGYSAWTCASALSLSPAPIDCRYLEIFICFDAVFLPYSHIYLCTAALQKCRSGGSVYSSSILFLQKKLCTLTNNVISRVAWSEGYSARTCALSPQPQLTVVVVKYSSISLPFFCLTVTSICAQLSCRNAKVVGQSTVPPFCSYKKNVYSNQQRYFARCLVGRLLCSDFCSLPSPN